MIVFPAIDIRDGQCVRLKRGDFSTAAKVAEDPVKTAKSFQDKGAEWIHMVDLDGALLGSRKNSDIILTVASHVDCKIQVGGGIRDLSTIDYYLKNGVERVILGSAAIDDPDLVTAAIEAYGERIAVGIDAMKGTARGGGWLVDSRVNYIDLAKAMERIGVSYLIYTDISKDGMLSGPNMEELIALRDSVSCRIIASGGVRDLSHIKELSAENLYGVICGKSIYQGTLDLESAINFSKRGEA